MPCSICIEGGTQRLMAFLLLQQKAAKRGKEEEEDFCALIFLVRERERARVEGVLLSYSCNPWSILGLVPIFLHPKKGIVP